MSVKAPYEILMGTGTYLVKPYFEIFYSIFKFHIKCILQFDYLIAIGGAPLGWRLSVFVNTVSCELLTYFLF